VSKKTDRYDSYDINSPIHNVQSLFLPGTDLIQLWIHGVKKFLN